MVLLLVLWFLVTAAHDAGYAGPSCAYASAPVATHWIPLPAAATSVTPPLRNRTLFWFLKRCLPGLEQRSGRTISRVVPLYWVVLRDNNVLPLRTGYRHTGSCSRDLQFLPAPCISCLHACRSAYHAYRLPRFCTQQVRFCTCTLRALHRLPPGSPPPPHAVLFL